MTSADRGRILVVSAAVLWSFSGAFTKILTQPTALGLHEPALSSIQIAFYRAVFAGLVLLPLVRRRDVVVRPATIGMVASFAAMNAMFITAMTIDRAANAILLQYTAPIWVLLLGRWLLKDPVSTVDLAVILVGTLGVAVILAGNWAGGNPLALTLAVGSGVTYAGVLIGLRLLRNDSASWLTAANHLGAAAILLAFAGGTAPTASQLICLAVFGTVQMGLPYFLMARGLKSITPQEAGALTLLEPLLNPLWAWIASPSTETPTPATLIGGAIILSALAVKYVWPAPLSPKPLENPVAGD